MIEYILSLLTLSVFAQGSIDTPGDLDLSVNLPNPLTGINSIPEFIKALLDIALSIGTWVAVLFIIYSGFLFIKARGDVKGLEEAKKTFFGTMIGTAILLGAYVIAAAIQGTITQLGVTP